MFDQPGIQPRRRFLGRVAAALAAVATGIPSIAQAAEPSGKDDTAEHDAWMTALKGKHRQFFHALGAQDTAMLMAANYLDAYGESFGAKPGEANAVIGMHGPALSIGFNDAAWAKYELGKGSSVTDPGTKAPAVKNIFATGGPLAVDTLQKKGVVFLLCNKALGIRARGLATARGEAFETVYEDLKASRLPGIVIVPAMVVAINRAQEAGFTYLRAS